VHAVQAVAPVAVLLKLPELHARHALGGPAVALYVTLNGVFLTVLPSDVILKDA
jgi:hypothetical protein